MAAGAQASPIEEWASYVGQSDTGVVDYRCARVVNRVSRRRLTTNPRPAARNSLLSCSCWDMGISVLEHRNLGREVHPMRSQD